MLPSRPRAFLLVASVAAVIAYAALLGRGFTSEDFLLVRFLGEHPPWRDVAAQLTSPWLGISGIRFLRPLSTTLYALEIAVFGTQSVGFNCVHVLVHALNSLLVTLAIRELLARNGEAQRAGGAERAAAAGGLLFAIHPLHPNTVVFSASFATLFGAGFVFAALLAYLTWRRTSRRRWWALSLATFAAALLSYEATAVLPLWLAAADHLGIPGASRPHLRRIAGWLPFAALLAGYLGWRRWVFGVVIGGYDATSQRLLGSPPIELATVVARSVRRLWLPYFGLAMGPVALAMATLLLVTVPALWLFQTRDRGAARSWLTGWLWLLVGLAPFGFEAMVPGNGRYGYLAAAGAALAIAAAVAAAPTGEPRRSRRALPWLAAAALTLVWGALLAEHLRASARAADTAQRVRRALLATAGRAPAGPRFLANYPYFVKAGNGDPAAQVFHYGLRDAVTPPFARPGADVLPLPPLAGDELLPVVRSAPGRVWEWTERSELRPAAMHSAIAPVELIVETPPAAGAAQPAALVRVGPAPPRRFRLLVAAPVNGAVFDVPAPPAGSALLRVEMPRDFLRTNLALYGPSTVYWWLEGRDEAGALVAYTRLRPLRVAAPPTARSH